jgi:hypothetical protein
MKLPDTVYDILKWVIALVLPAVAGLYANLGPDWGWYNPQLVVKTITEVQIFLGVIFGISCYQYKQDQKFKNAGDC